MYARFSLEHWIQSQTQGETHHWVNASKKRNNSHKTTKTTRDGVVFYITTYLYGKWYLLKRMRTTQSVVKYKRTIYTKHQASVVCTLHSYIYIQYRRRALLFSSKKVSQPHMFHSQRIAKLNRYINSHFKVVCLSFWRVLCARTQIYTLA